MRRSKYISEILHIDVYFFTSSFKSYQKTTRYKGMTRATPNQLLEGLTEEKICVRKDCVVSKIVSQPIVLQDDYQGKGNYYLILHTRLNLHSLSFTVFLFCIPLFCILSLLQFSSFVRYRYNWLYNLLYLLQQSS